MAKVTPIKRTRKRSAILKENSIDIGLGSPVTLSRDTEIWRVVGKSVEVFIETPTLRRLLVIVADGDYIFGLPKGNEGTISVTADAGTRLVPLFISDVEAAGESLVETDGLTSSADNWLHGISRHFEGLEQSDDTSQVIAAEQSVNVTEETVLTAQNTPCWLQLPFGQSVTYEGSDLVLSGPASFPVVSGIKLKTHIEGDVEGVGTDVLAENGQLCLSILSFNAVLADLFKALSDHHDAETTERLAASEGRASAQHNFRLNRLASLGRQQDNRIQSKGRTAEVIVRVAASLGVEVDGAKLSAAQGQLTEIPGLLRQAGLRSRQVLLRDNWWRNDLGGLIALHSGTGELVGLMRKRGKYLIYDPETGVEEKLTRGVAKQLCGPGFAITPQLATDVGDFKSLTKFILGRLRGDAALSVIAGACIAFLGVLTPLITAVIIDRIIPGNARNLIVEVGVALVLIAVLTAFINVARNIAEARIETQTATDMQLSVMNRILSLKPVFFRDSSAGDLSQRMEGLDALRGAVVSFVLQATLTITFFVFYTALLFSFDKMLALSAVALVFFIAAMTLVVRALQARDRKSILQYNGRLRSLVFEILDAVPKLRIAAAEERMIGRWAHIFYNEQSAILRFQRIGNRFASFGASYQILSLLLLFAVAVFISKNDLSAGAFVAFLLAFGAFQNIVLGFCASLVGLMAGMPRLERALPFLQAELENNTTAIDPGALSGRIEMSGIRFAYDEKGPNVLNKLNLKINSGEHIAIVGGSGSGKSSILRLLLGFEKPLAGSVTYDGKELSHLDVSRVRQQIGVVMQSSNLFAGSIYENIQGAGNASLQRCEEAAEMAGLTADLELFPMGMHTPLTEGAGTISGGQKQRILIARALAGSPQILFMDEATSALDNTTQAIVSRALDGLNLTRLTVAHRLSTVRSADHICVLQDGSFVEQGTYDELLSANGIFAELAKRQLS